MLFAVVRMAVRCGGTWRKMLLLKGAGGLRDHYWADDGFFVELVRQGPIHLVNLYPVSYTHLTLPTKRIV